jgi:hypothetical protein
MRSEFAQDVLGIDESTHSDVSIRVSERLVESGAVGIVQPVAGIKRKEFDFSAVREIRRLVDDDSTRFDPGFDGHGGSGPFEWPPNKALHPTQVSASVDVTS